MNDGETPYEDVERKAHCLQVLLQAGADLSLNIPSQSDEDPHCSWAHQIGNISMVNSSIRRHFCKVMLIENY